MSAANSEPHTGIPKGDEASGIVFFDGVCGLCNRFVDFAMSRDRQERLQFAPLQGETAERLLTATDREVDSMLFLSKGRVSDRSGAVVRALRGLGGVWSVVAFVLWLVPRPLRDLGYRVVAANRLGIFGERDTCRLPTEAEAGRLLP